MLLAGMDVSGNPNETNYKFLGVVIGTHESIMGLSKQLGDLSRTYGLVKMIRKNNLCMKSYRLNKRNRIAFCVTLDRSNIIQRVENKIAKRKRKGGKYFRTYNRVVMQLLREHIEEFLLKNHHGSITELIIQGEGDSKPFTKAGNIKFQRKGAAYRISDYVAWMNNRGKSPS